MGKNDINESTTEPRKGRHPAQFGKASYNKVPDVAPTGACEDFHISLSPRLRRGLNDGARSAGLCRTEARRYDAQSEEL